MKKSSLFSRVVVPTKSNKVVAFSFLNRWLSTAGWEFTGIRLAVLVVSCLAARAEAFEVWGYGRNQGVASSNNATPIGFGQWWKANTNTTLDFGQWEALRNPPSTVSGVSVQPISAATTQSQGPQNPGNQPNTLLLNGNGLILACGYDDSMRFYFGGSATALANSGSGTPHWLEYSPGVRVRNVIALPNNFQAFHSAALLCDGRVLIWGYAGQQYPTYGPLEGTLPSGPTPISILKTPGSIKQVAKTGATTFLLSASGKLYSVGPSDTHGVLGRNTAFPPGTIKEVEYLTTGPAGTPPVIKDVAGGLAFGAALDASGQVWTWGVNDQGQLGYGFHAPNQDSKTLAVPAGAIKARLVPGLTGIKQVACSQTALFALRDDGTVWAAGENGHGQLGVNPSSPPQIFDSATQIPGLQRIIGIWPMSWGAYFLRDDGIVLALGQSDGYSIPGAAPGPVFVPHQLSFPGTPQPPPINVGVLSALPSLLVRSTGDTMGWGLNSTLPLVPNVQPLGSGPSGVVASPTLMSHPGFTGGGKFKALTTGRFQHPTGLYSLGLGPDGTLWSAGTQTPGVPALGNGGASNSSTFVQVYSQLPRVTQVDTHEGTTVALRSDGTLLGFGRNPDRAAVPVAVAAPTSISQPGPAGGPKVIKVSVGRDHTLALTSEGVVWAKGSDALQAQGNGPGVVNQHTQWDRVRMNNATQILDQVIDIATAGNFCMALRGDGSVWVWGQGNTSQLAGTVVAPATGDVARQVATPPNVNGFANNIKAIAVGSGSVPGGLTGQEFAIVLTGNGTVWTWGGNNQGQLGSPPTQPNEHSPTPRRVSGPNRALNETVKEIGASYRLGAAVLADGSLWTWGRNDEGQAGTGAATLSVAQVGQRSPGTWFYKFAGGSSGAGVFAITTDN